jgi:RNA polymerase sigma-70 factor (ECF subfamily)
MSADTGFEEMFRREYPRVLRTVALIVMNAEVAEEVTQEAFTELHLKWARIGSYERPGAWVRRVAIRKAVRGRRRAAQGAQLEALTGESQTVDDMKPDIDLVRAVASLPAQQRAAIVLHYYDDLSVGEVADVLGCAEPTVRVHLHRGRARLAELLRLDEEVDDVTR